MSLTQNGNRKQDLPKCKECGYAIPHEARDCLGCGNPRPLEAYGTPMQWVLKHPDLTTFDKYLYALLATYANRNTGIVDMAIPAIAKQAGASRKGIDGSIRRLKEVGALGRISRRRQRGKWHLKCGHLQGKPGFNLPSGERVDGGDLPSGERYHTEERRERKKKPLQESRYEHTPCSSPSCQICNDGVARNGAEIKSLENAISKQIGEQT